MLERPREVLVPEERARVLLNLLDKTAFEVFEPRVELFAQVVM
jgi:hypothetical protein